MKTMVRIAAVVLLTAGAALAIARWVIHPLRCSRAASFGAAALEVNDTPAAARGIRAELASCTCVTPPDVLIPVALGAAAKAEGDPPVAIAEYQHALEIDRRPEIYFQLGLAQLEAGDRPAALESLVRACAFDPARLTDIYDAEIRREATQVIQRGYGSGWTR